jgi:predicted Zn-dependent protease
MYSRDEIKALTDRVLNIAKADAVEVSFEGGERSATRWTNSSISVNLMQYDRQRVEIFRVHRRLLYRARDVRDHAVVQRIGAMLTIHEIVAHATELDRILGYEANYAGTSFVKLSDVGKLKYGAKLMNITADRTVPGGMASKGCTSASSWRDYSFLRIPNVRLEAGPKGSPNVEQMIAATKDGVLIDGRGS